MIEIQFKSLVFIPFVEQTVDPWTWKKTTWIYWRPWAARKPQSSDFQVPSSRFQEYDWIPMELKTTKTGTTPAGSEWAKVTIPKALRTQDRWAFKDVVEVPKNLAPGDYVLSFRWDCLESPQIWSACANIKIIEKEDNLDSPCSSDGTWTWKTTGNDECCSNGITGFCGEGEGDCDAHSECAGSLICGNDNCPWGDGDDCCMQP